MKALTKIALIFSMIILCSGAFAQQRFLVPLTDPNYQPGDTYTINAKLYYNGTWVKDLENNAPVSLMSVNAFPFTFTYQGPSNYQVRVWIFKNGVGSSIYYPSKLFTYFYYLGYDIRVPINL